MKHHLYSGGVKLCVTEDEEDYEHYGFSVATHVTKKLHEIIDVSNVMEIVNV